MTASVSLRARNRSRPRRPHRTVLQLETLEDRSLLSLTLLGHNDFGGAGFNANVWGHGDFAYVGRWGRVAEGQCPGTGVQIVDISDPTNPEEVASAAAYPDTSAEDMRVQRIHTRFFRGDLLAVGIQRCVPFGAGVEGGLDLWDVRDPRNPVHLSFLSVGEGSTVPGRGVHELYLFQRGQRAYVLMSDFNAEVDTYLRGIDRGLDVKIVEVTDPRNPVVVGQWGAYTYLGITPGMRMEGGLIRLSFAHSVSANRTGTLAFASYGDTGMVVLDISDPAHPRFLGRSQYGPDEDGAAHSAIAARGDRLAIVTEEDWSPLPAYAAPGDQFPGWGFARLFDISDRTNPVQVSTFATPNSLTERDDGFYSVHNPVIRGNTLYLSWYSDGLRVIDVSNPAAPREVDSFVPPAHPDPFGHLLPGQSFPMVWGVWVGRGIILLSDINSGLYVLRDDANSVPDDDESNPGNQVGSNEDAIALVTPRAVPLDVTWFPPVGVREPQAPAPAQMPGQTLASLVGEEHVVRKPAAFGTRRVSAERSVTDSFDLVFVDARGGLVDDAILDNLASAPLG